MFGTCSSPFLHIQQSGTTLNSTGTHILSWLRGLSTPMSMMSQYWNSPGLILRWSAILIRQWPCIESSEPTRNGPFVQNHVIEIHEKISRTCGITVQESPILRTYLQGEWQCLSCSWAVCDNMEQTGWMVVWPWMMLIIPLKCQKSVPKSWKPAIRKP